LNRLFQMMRDKLAVGEPRFSTAVPQYDPFRPGDIRFSGASIEKARSMLSYTPTHSVDDGLTEALGWYVERAKTPSNRPVAATARHAAGSVVNHVSQNGKPLTVAAS